MRRMKWERGYIINQISCQHHRDEVDNNLLIQCIRHINCFLLGYYILNSIMTVCFTLIMMCFPFYNSKYTFNLPDLEHEVIKNNSQGIVAKGLFNGVTRKRHGTDQWGNLFSAQTASSRWLPSRERFYHPLYHECQEHVDLGQNTQLIKETQKNSNVWRRQGRMVEGGGDWVSDLDHHTVIFSNQSLGFQCW